MRYYAIIGGQKVGPLESGELVKMYDINGSTLLWCSGLPDWTAAKDIAEIAPLLPPTMPAEPTTVYDQPQPAAQPYVAPQQPYQQPQPYQPQPYQQPYQQPSHQPYQQPQPRVTPQNQPNPQNIDRGAPYNWLGWAIFATVFGLAFYIIGAVPGIIGIVFTSQAKSKYRMGDYVGAYKDNTVAKILTIIGLCISGISLIIIILSIIFVGAAFSML